MSKAMTAGNWGGGGGVGGAVAVEIRGEEV